MVEQWHYVATRLIAHMGPYNRDEMNGLNWQWHQRAACASVRSCRSTTSWTSLGHRATKDTPQATGGRGTKTSRSIPGRRRAVTPWNAHGGHHQGWVPPLAHTEAPCEHSARGEARAVLTPRGCKAASRNNAKIPSPQPHAASCGTASRLP